MWRRSGSSPAPSAGGLAAVLNGLANRTFRPVKKTAIPNSTACAYGTISRTRRRVRNSARLDQNASSITHSSSEPCCVDQMAAAR